MLLVLLRHDEGAKEVAMPLMIWMDILPACYSALSTTQAWQSSRSSVLNNDSASGICSQMIGVMQGKDKVFIAEIFLQAVNIHCWPVSAAVHIQRSCHDELLL